jgi:hypothetical protein
VGIENGKEQKGEIQVSGVGRERGCIGMQCCRRNERSETELWQRI